MSNEKKIGKITSVSFGHCGYQDAMIGISFTLGSNSWGVGTDMSYWDSCLIKHTESSQWSESDRDNYYSKIMRYVSELLRDAKVSKVEDLKNIPIEAEFEGNMLKYWRILTEAI